jgi:hypothetical protein
MMVKKPNYGQERAQRSRVLQDRKQEKLQRREEESLKRKASRDGQPNPNPEPHKN